MEDVGGPYTEQRAWQGWHQANPGPCHLCPGVIFLLVGSAGTGAECRGRAWKSIG